MRKTSRPLVRNPFGLLAAAALAVVALICAAPAVAQTYTVTNLSDSGVAGDGSLRGEIRAANAQAGADSVVFAPGLSGTITISGTGLVDQGPIAIEGPGPGAIVVRQISGGHRVLQVKLKEPGPVSISGLTLTGGETSGPGGDLEYDAEGEPATLTVTDCLIAGGETQDYGGGIASIGAPLTLRDSVVTENEGDSGGGVWAGGDKTPFTIEGSTISGNESTGPGGGLNGEVEGGGHDTIVDSTVAGNISGNEGGGATFSLGTGTSLTIANSTFAENVADDGGGGLEIDTFEEAPVATIEDSTIAGNHAGGLLGEAGGVETFGTVPQILLDSIVAGNTGGDADVYGPWATAFSLIGDPTGGKLSETVPGSDLIGVDPQLGPLGANGGPTATMAPSPGSPVVNKGGGTLGTDQRGDPRPIVYPRIALSAAAGANGADIGAVELQAPSLSVQPTPPANSGPAPSPPPVAGPPRVRVACPSGAAPGGCRFALQVFSSRPRPGKGKGRRGRAAAPVAESAIARLKLRPGKHATVALKPKPRFAAKLEAAKTLLVREVETVNGTVRTAYRRLKVLG